MITYPKIESLYNRDMKTHKVIEGDYRLPEFEYLKDCYWIATEKVDGTNVRVGWVQGKRTIGGRTESAQLQTSLLEAVDKLIPQGKLEQIWPDPDVGVVLFGEGYGPKIQKGGGLYRDDQSFILFDVWVNGWWLLYKDVCDIADRMCLDVVPVIGHDKPDYLALTTKAGKMSLVTHMNQIDGTKADRSTSRAIEGMVMVPDVPLYSRNGKRIIAKIKTKDFANENGVNIPV